MAGNSDEKRIPLGPRGRWLAHALRMYREERGLTYKDLSARLRDLGRPIAPLGLSRIERGDRRVDLDDLIAIARAFGDMSPLLLLFPIGREPTTELPGTTLPTWTAVEWFTGELSLEWLAGDVDYDDDFYDPHGPGNEPLALYRQHDRLVGTVVRNRRRLDAESGPDLTAAREVYEMSVKSLLDCRQSIRSRGLLAPKLWHGIKHLEDGGGPDAAAAED